ncbi:hypothetical protein [Sphingomonas xinjiangensis]|uniref:Uncharacterized protein n=1 Tax=Sphingomonas xinjiangensis TaxID=643568 RepID=A0A840YJ72_9SPHN|nr:hypothetical protein [Sphingomonas xinjiangensis]MBB5712189.1 hypothetical protein [Sphingomonas xinjiangensis]
MVEAPVDIGSGRSLLDQQGRGDWIGSLAKQQSRTAPPEGRQPRGVRARLETLGADSDTFGALDDAERPWLRQ